MTEPYFFEGALNANMYADFLENILNQPKCYESVTVLEEERGYVLNRMDYSLSIYNHFVTFANINSQNNDIVFSMFFSLKE